MHGNLDQRKREKKLRVHELRVQVKRAAAACPVQAISIGQQANDQKSAANQIIRAIFIYFAPNFYVLCFVLVLMPKDCNVIEPRCNTQCHYLGDYINGITNNTFLLLRYNMSTRRPSFEQL